MDNGNGLKNSVLKELKTGRARAIPGSLLAKRLGFNNDRPVRYAIRELIADGVPVIAAVTKPYGYFIASSREEVQEYAGILKSRGIEDILRRRDLLRASLEFLRPGQLRLKL